MAWAKGSLPAAAPAPFPLAPRGVLGYACGGGMATRHPPLEDAMQPDIRNLLNTLARTHRLTTAEYATLVRAWPDAATRAHAADLAVIAREPHYGTNVYVRGLIEYSNHCRNNCLYCGIRRDNTGLARYRLTPEEIYACCARGYALGFRTFVLQGGEDPYFTDARLCPIIAHMRANWPDCAITLSLGERSRTSYERLYAAGANRYLLRHETADKALYASLHPQGLSWERRMRCLADLRAIGYQTGCGFMVGPPGQTPDMLAKDLAYIQHSDPAMVGIGPFLPHRDTPFAHAPKGSMELTLYLLSLVRLIKPTVLLPATTALGTIHPQGRELGLLAGANVVMPNLSPEGVRGKYALYDNKLFTGAESADGRGELAQKLAALGYTVVSARGDVKNNSV